MLFSACAVALLAAAPQSPLLPSGVYRCAVFGGSVMLSGGGGSRFSGGSSAGANLILEDGRYRFGAPSLGYRSGTYAYDPATSRVAFTGMLSGAYARAISSFGTPAVNFPFDKNRTALNGGPLAGGPMSCYHKR